jgi:GDP-L-fucose synthase
MKILVTGGTGFIGSHLNADIKLSSKDVDLQNLEQTINNFKQHSPDIIIHTAARQKNYLGMQSSIADHLYDNALINLNVFKAAQIANVKKIISLSSINAFPADTNNDYYDESNLWNGEPHTACYSDGYKNRLLHVLSKVYNLQYDMSCIVPMLSNTYGPNSRIDNGAIPFLINKCYNAKINNTDLIISGDGSAKRDFIYVEDVAKLIHWSIDNYNSVDPIIFASGKQTTIKHVVNIITDIMQFNGNVIWDTTASVGQSTKLCDNSKLKTCLPNFKFTSIEDGIKKMINLKDVL